MNRLKQILIGCLRAVGYTDPVDDDERYSLSYHETESLLVHIYIHSPTGRIDTWLVPVEVLRQQIEKIGLL